MEPGRKNSAAFGRPEIHFIQHNFCITYSMQGGGTGILISKTGKPEGPYINPIKADAPLTDGIDATIFQDDDGKGLFHQRQCGANLSDEG